MTLHTKKQIHILFKAFYVMAIGLLFFKFIPMKIWGENILFDASFHITSAIFVLYILWFFVDQNKSWRLPFLLFCFLVLAIISFQRIYDNAHNDAGLLAGLIISITAIFYSQFDRFKNKLLF